MSDSKTCLACGALIKQDAEQCDLCGASVSDHSFDVFDDAENEGVAEVVEAGVDGADEEERGGVAYVDEQASLASDGVPNPASGVFCNSCGWKNPHGARFCSQCGTKLQEVAASVPSSGPASAASSSRSKPAPRVLPTPIPQAEAPPPEAATNGMGRQVSIVVGAGVLLVLALFLITVVSKELGTTGQTQTAPQQTVERPSGPPLNGDVAAQAQEMRSEIAALQGIAADLKRKDLINLYAQSGRLDLAAEEQVALARSEGTEEAWILAGNLYYDWMERQIPRDQAYFAQQAIAAYQQALELNPENLDVRTDMAIAYLFDPNNPMEAIRQTNMVLEQDSTHIQANFNRGYMLMQIGRFEQAREQFQKVKILIGDPADEVFERANQALDVIDDLESQQAETPGATS